MVQEAIGKDLSFNFIEMISNVQTPIQLSRDSPYNSKVIQYDFIIWNKKRQSNGFQKRNGTVNSNQRHFVCVECVGAQPHFEKVTNNKDKQYKKKRI